MIDTHLGRSNPVFTLLSDPEKFIGIINRHGILSRVMQARKCPCVQANGSPTMYCPVCNGDGVIYNFQRLLLQVDEDTGDRDWVTDPNDPRATINIYPFRQPVIRPIKAERMNQPELGGIVEYNIVGYGSNYITISRKNPTDPYPLHYEKMRVSYYFDRFNLVEKEYPVVQGNTLIVQQTRYDDGHRTSNILNVNGDIAIIHKIWDEDTGFEYTNYTFKKNQVYVSLQPTDPPLTQGKTAIKYHYCPPTKVLPADPTIRIEQDKWELQLKSGTIRIALEPFYRLAEGDIITLLTTIYYRNEILVHSVQDKLMEFDVAYIEDDIIDEEGKTYRNNIDFVIKNYRDIEWIGNQPAIGTKISVRYGYYPTFIVYQDEPIINSLENKFYPTIVYAKLWNKTLVRDYIAIDNPRYE